MENQLSAKDAKIANFFVWATTGLGVLNSIAFIILLLFLIASKSGQDVDQGLIGIIDNAAVAFSTGMMLFFVLGIYPVLKWFYRCHKKTAAQPNVKLRYSSKELIWSFFIPIYNIIAVSNSVKEMASNIKNLQTANAIKPSTLIDIWWGFYLLSTFANKYGYKSNSETVENYIIESSFYLAASLSIVVSGFALIKLISRFTNTLLSGRESTS